MNHSGFRITGQLPMSKLDQEKTTATCDVTAPWPAPPSPEMQGLKGVSRDEPTGQAAPCKFNQGIQAAYPQIQEVQVTLPGNPEVGVIHHLANQHEARYGQDFYDLKNLGERNIGVVMRLRDLGVQHCFLEGYQAGQDITASKAVQQKLNQTFPHGEIPNTFDDTQKLLLARHFDECLLHFFPNMTFHGTEPPRGTVAAADRPGASAQLRRDLVFSLRERYALESITKCLAELEADKKTVALIYGRGHTWDPTVLGEARALDESPRVIKESFQNWSLYHWAKELQDAGSAEEQIRLLQPERRYSSWVWGRLHSPEAQLMALPQLKLDIDFQPDPIRFADCLIHQIKPGNGETRTKLFAAIHAHREAHSGPFADLFLRPEADEALKRARGQYSALAIWDETHAFTQLECVRAASSIGSYAWSKIITATAQLAALPKLVFDGTSRDESVNTLLRGAVNETVKEEIERRAQNGEAPFVRS